jgi:DNA-binding LacI/PurR family transcriptional regulator
MALKNDREISKATCQRVQAAAREMGYQPNPVAATLANLKRQTQNLPIQAALAWLNFWPEPKKLRSYPEFERYWQGADACAKKFGYRLEEFMWNRNVHPRRLVEILRTRGVEGILLPPHPFELSCEDFQWEHFAVVRFGRSFTDPSTHLVTADHVGNTFMAVDAMRARGYKRIGLVTLKDARRKWLFEAGFSATQAELNERDRVSIFYLENPADSDAQAKLLRWLTDEKPDALLTPSPNLRQILERAGYRVPDDIGLAVTSVLDGNADAGIDQNPDEIGRVALLMLQSLIRDNNKGIPQLPREVLIKGRWVDGATLPDRRQVSTYAPNVIA